MISLLIAGLIQSAAPQPSAEVSLKMKTVGVVAPARGGMVRCRWTATVDGQTLAGERPGDCLIHRAAIAREVAARAAR